MTEEKPEKEVQNICNLNYLIEMMNGKKTVIYGIMETFLKQLPKELNNINEAVTNSDYAGIKSYAHTMKSTVSIMDISILAPVLQEMQDLGTAAANIDRIKELNQKLNSVCKQAIEEIEREKIKYV